MHHRSILSLEIARHGSLISLVEQMLELHRQLAAARTSYEKRRCRGRSRPRMGRSIGWCAELHDLTEEEIGLWKLLRTKAHRKLSL